MLSEAEVVQQIRTRFMHTLELGGSVGPRVQLRYVVGLDLLELMPGEWSVGWRTALGRQLVVPLAPFPTRAEAQACAERLAVPMREGLALLNAQGSSPGSDWD